MSTATRSDRGNEALFVAGVLVGSLVFVLGFAFLILGLSTGVRETGFLSSGTDRAAAMVAGVAGMAAGIGLRYVRYRLDDGGLRLALRHGGSLAVLAGVTAFLLGFSAEQTNSAPFLGSTSQKAALVVLALGFMIAGALLVRLAGRRIGW